MRTQMFMRISEFLKSTNMLHLLSEDEDIVVVAHNRPLFLVRLARRVDVNSAAGLMTAYDLRDRRKALIEAALEDES